MLKILDKYVLKTFIFSYFVCAFVFVGIFLLGDLLSRIGDVLNQMESKDAVTITVQYYLSKIPYFYHSASVALTLMAALFTITKLNKSNEIMPFMMGGISLYRMLRPILVAGAAIVLLLYVVQEAIIPNTESKSVIIKELLEGRDEKQLDAITMLDLYDNFWYIRLLDRNPDATAQKTAAEISRQIEERIRAGGYSNRLPKIEQDWLIEHRNLPNDRQDLERFLRAAALFDTSAPEFVENVNTLRQYLPYHREKILMTDVIITRLSQPGKVKFQVLADAAVYKSDRSGNRWDLYNAVVHRFDVEPITVNRREVLPLPIVARTSPEIADRACTDIDREALTNPREMEIEPASKSWFELLDITEKRQLKHFKVLLYSRLTSPLASFVLLMIGLSLSFRGENARSTMVGIATGLAVCIAFVVFNLWITHMGGQGVISPYMAALAPLVLFGAIGVYLFSFIRT